MKKTLIAFLILVAPAFASAQDTVTGHVKQPDASIPSNTKICVSLINFKPNVARVIGTGQIIVTTNYCTTPAADGSYSFNIYGNDVISPTASNWRVDWIVNGIQSASATYLINHSPFNLDTETPLSTTTPAGPNQQVTQAFPFTQLAASTTWTIPHNFNDPNTIALVAGANGNDIYPDTKNCRTDPNNCVLTFVSPTAGFAIAMHAGAINIATTQPNALIANPTSPQSVNSQPLNLSGPLTGGNINNVLFAGPGVSPSIDTQLTACGSVNPCQIWVAPGYTGTFPPVNPVTPNIRIEDMHSPGPSPNPLGANTDTWNGLTSGGVQSWLRHSWTLTVPDVTHSYELTTNLASYSGSLPGSGNSIEGATSVATITGTPTFAGSTLNLVGLESHAYTQSTGGTLPNAFGSVTSAGQQSGTTNITTAAGLFVQTNPNAGGNTQNNYGIFMQVQNGGTARNFSFYSQGAGLFSSDAGGSGINFEDSALATHPVLTALSATNQMRFRPLLDTAGFCFDNAISTADWMCLKSTGVSIPTVGLSIGGGTSLVTTNQSGIGSLCMTTSCVLTTPNIGAATTASQITSTLATGTAPFSVSSTTPVVNLTTAPTTYNAAGAQVVGAHISEDSGVLVSGTPSTGTVTLAGSAAFTSNATYHCTVTNQTTQANPLKITYTDGSHFVVTGPNTVTDSFSFICVGN